MASYTALDILTEAAALLNDPTQKLYTNTILLPYCKRAFRDLILKLHLEQVQVLGEVDTPATISANQKTYAGPTDLVLPIEMSERPAGQSGIPYTPMYEKQWEPDIVPINVLRYWTWREQTFNFVGATSAVEILLKYFKAPTAIADQNSIIQINNSLPYLSAKTAYYCAAFVGENPTKAEMLKIEAQESLEDFLATEAMRRQSMPVRRLPASRSLNRAFIK